jgi:hypothetical protein
VRSARSSSWIVSSSSSELRTASGRISDEPTAFLAISRAVTLSRGSVTAAVAVPPSATKRARVAVMLAYLGM